MSKKTNSMLLMNECAVYENGPAIIDIDEVWDLIEKAKIEPKKVNIDEIFYLPFSGSYGDIDTESERYKNADTSFPVVLLTGLEKRDGKKYRMVDGRRRLLKTMTTEETSINAYILSFSEVEFAIT